MHNDRFIFIKLYWIKLKILLILACCDHLCEAVSAHTSIPGRCDGDVVLCPTIQWAQVTAAACASAIVPVTHFVNRRHRVHDSRHAGVPGHGHNSGAAVSGSKEGRERAGSCAENERRWRSRRREHCWGEDTRWQNCTKKKLVWKKKTLK